MTDDYSRALARACVGQLAEQAGYEAVQESAAEVCTDLLIKYATDLAGAAHDYAELANRTGVNLHDLLLALDDLGTSVPELLAYHNTLAPEDNTLTHPTVDYPIRKPVRSLPTWQAKQETPPPHIPPFLPAFPDKHTYQAAPTFAGHETHPDKQAKIQARARKQGEAALLKLHHATAAAAKASRQPGAGGSSGGGAAAPPEPPGNPFLAPPALRVVTPGAGGPAANGAGAAYEPHAAAKAFAPVLGTAVAGRGSEPAGDGHGGGAAQPEVKMEVDGAGLGLDDLLAPEELTWRYEARLDEKGALLQPLGTSADYASLTAGAAHTYAVGRREPDAYEEAAKEEAAAAGGGAGGSGHARRRKSAYGTVVDPVKKRAQEVLDRARDPAAMGDGED